MRHRGYIPLSTASYGPQYTLHVLVGTAGDGSRPGERAFFFNEKTYLGTDASAPSARISVLAHSDSEVTLGYAIRGSGSLQAVRFALDMGLLSALDPLPSAAERG
jgi:hypothetical protein